MRGRERFDQGEGFPVSLSARGLLVADAERDDLGVWTAALEKLGDLTEQI